MTGWEGLVEKEGRLQAWSERVRRLWKTKSGESIEEVPVIGRYEMNRKTRVLQCQLYVAVAGYSPG